MIKDQELAKQIFEMINTAVEASEQMILFLGNRQLQEFRQLGEDMYVLIKSIRGMADALKEEEDGLNLPEASQSIMVSVARILAIAKNDIVRATHKVEFELLPLLEEMRVTFYYWGMVYPDKEKIKKYYAEDVHILAGNRYTRVAELTGKYKYDLSIFVVGYNKMDYTNMCIKSLYENLPTDITYEIILVNHGSNDGTKELFEAYQPTKQLDIAVNGGGSNAVFRITEGKYILMISNDVLVTKNAIDNLYKCISSDEKIAWVVPSTPNISNLQTIPAEYHNLDEMKEFAKKNNVSNPYRWEQRVRLCNPIDVVRASFVEKIKAQHIFHSKNRMSFPDDRKSMLCRRNGYKMYLVKDAYCYHFGQITLKEDKKTNSQEAFNKGREDFISAFGIDPWGKGFCYTMDLISNLKCDNEGEVKILGIEAGLGSNPLKIKEKIKENMHNNQVYLKNVTTNKRWYEEQYGVSDQVELVTSHKAIWNDKEKYHYVVNETLIENKHHLREEWNLSKAVAEEDAVIIMLIKDSLKNMAKKIAEEKEILIVDNVPANRYPVGSFWMIVEV